MLKIFVLLFFLGFQFFNCGSFIGQKTIDLSIAEKEWIAKNDTVYFGYDPDWKPYQFINEKGEHDGIIEPIMDIIRNRSGLNLQPLPGQSWISSVKSLKSGQLQVLPAVAVSEDRLKFMDYTSSYISFSFVIINSKEGKFIGDINDLENLTIALPRGYIVTENIERDYPNFNIIYTNNLEDALLKILTKEVDATIAGLPIASYYMNYVGFDHLQIAANVEEYEMDLNMSVLKGNDTLLGILEKSLNSISNKEKQEIINEWVTVKYEHGVDMTRVWKIAAICALIVIFVIGVIAFWNRSLKKEIRKRIEVEEKLQTSLQEIQYQKLIVDEKSQEITDSIQYAKRIQSAILPSSKVIDEFLKDSFVLYKPKDIVAGDFYWLEAKEDRILFAAADCTGHGVPGAMVSVVCNNALNRSVREHGLTDPGEILDKTREIVIQEFEKSEDEVMDGMDIAICSLIGNKLEYAGAHNPLWIVRNGILLETKANKQPIGKFDNLLPYTTHSFVLEKGDTIYIFSDGYSDQFGGEKGKKYKSGNFKKFLLSIQENSMDKQLAMLNEEFEKWRGSIEQIDDVCVIGIRT
jgi:serine phosphatase RsbU (regulator of sigma subunit)